MSALPQNFIDHYKKLLPENDAKEFFEYCLKPLRKAVRVNTLKYSVSDFLEFSKKQNWKLSPVPWCNEGFFVERNAEEAEDNQEKKQKPMPLGLSIPHALGGIYVQEASSMMPVTALFHGHEETDFTDKTIGDLAASPGSKSTQIASVMKGKGILLTNELSSTRLKALYSNLERCGVQNNVLTHYDAENLCFLLPETFDFLLLDAPCTGEGTVRKNYKALENWSENDAISMGELQKKLLYAAFTALKPGGELVYSTCTLSDKENRDVVLYLQSEFPDEVEFISLKNLFPESEKSASPEGFLQVWPQIFDSEGFFVAKIRKKNTQNNQYKKESVLKKFPFEKVRKNKSKERNAFFVEQWGIEVPEYFEWWQRDKEWWIFPKNIETLVSRMKADRIGVKMGELHAKGWKTAYEFCTHFGKECTKNILEITEDQVLEVYKGINISFDSSLPDGEYIVKHNGFSVAIGKMQKGKWKNQIPRVLLRDLKK